MNWYLFIYQIPPRPMYLRAKIRQRLVKLGAVSLKKSAYVLPAEKKLLEPLRAVAREAIDGGGEAYVCEARFVEGEVEKEILRRAASDRDADYKALVGEVRKASRQRRDDVVRRLRARLDDIRAVDFAGAPGARNAAAAMEDLETHAGRPTNKAPRTTVLKGKTWVTRKNIGIDRIATAWLVRRFIDAKARFRFIDAAAAPRRTNEIRFDIPGGDYTHEGKRCTFEVVLAAAGIRDKGLRAIGDIVHDNDLGGRKRRVESAGVGRMIAGIVRSNATDQARMARGAEIFDSLYEALSSN